MLHHSLCHADGQSLLLGSSGLAVWDAVTQQRLYKYPGHVVRLSQRLHTVDNLNHEMLLLVHCWQGFLSNDAKQGLLSLLPADVHGRSLCDMQPAHSLLNCCRLLQMH